jgi:hypothetical protein
MHKRAGNPLSGGPHIGGFPMYENAEVIIRLNNVEIQQAMAIWLDDDAQQALEFIKEKVVDKTAQAACKRSAVSKLAPCHLGMSNCSCCRAGGVGRGRQTRKAILSS